jgi:hypothetical protein
MTEVAFRHHTGRSMDFNIEAGPPSNPAGTVDTFIVSSGTFVDMIKFQSGTVNGDPNGLSTEALLEVCMIRLQTLNQGKHECGFNHVAIEKIGGAIDALKERAYERAKRGVLGTEKA